MGARRLPGVSVKNILWSEAIRARVDTGRPHFLARASIRAFAPRTFPEFLDVVARERLDLILIEAASEELPAVDLCLRLGADETTRSIPILVIAGEGPQADALRGAGCAGIVDPAIGSEGLQEKIAASLGMRLRKHTRYPVILPVARGRIFHEFLGYTNSVSEGGMGFETIIRIKGGDHLPLRIFRNSEEKPIGVVGRVCGVRPNLDTGIGYAVGVEFLRMSSDDRSRLRSLFPPDPCVTWGAEDPPDSAPSAR